MPNQPTQVIHSRFEIEEEGQTAYLSFETDGHGWLTLIHTEVPAALRGRGLATELVNTAFGYARDNNLKVDVICPLAASFVARNPEFQALIGHR